MRTYLKNRKCLHCNTSIADQEHGLQTFCPKQTLPDGSTKNCKDDYWSPIKKEAMTPFMEMAYFQKQQHENVGKLFKTKGEAVALDDINKYGINLFRPVEFKLEDRQYVFYFHQYGIKQLPDNQFKIFTHELH